MEAFFYINDRYIIHEMLSSSEGYAYVQHVLPISKNDVIKLSKANTTATVSITYSCYFIPPKAV